jgi:phosphate starvation-inducible membrane PsiE
MIVVLLEKALNVKDIKILRMIVRLYMELTLLLLLYSLIPWGEEIVNCRQQIFIAITAMIRIFVIQKEFKANCHSFLRNYDGCC